MRVVRLKTAAANAIAAQHGCRTLAERGAFYGVHETTYLRAAREREREDSSTVGSEFIANALSSRASREVAGFCFDTIFEVVDR